MIKNINHDQKTLSQKATPATKLTPRSLLTYSIRLKLTKNAVLAWQLI